MTQEQFNKMMDTYLTQRAVLPATQAWEQDTLNWATSTGLMQGDKNHNLMPKSFMTRIETATLLKRFQQYLENGHV